MLLKNAMIFNSSEIALKDIVCDNGIISKIEPAGSVSEAAAADKETFDCGGKLLVPGFIDAHVHLREPGFEKKETIETGSKAAAAGGFTTIMPMPNLKPVPDNADTMKAYAELIEQKAAVRVEPYASITLGEKGAEVVDMEALLEEGASAFSDDGVGVQNGEIMREAMIKAKALGKVIAAHTEDNSLKNKGCVHLGKFSEKAGLRGIPSECEYGQVARDIELVRETGAHYHVCHVSAKETVSLVRNAKAEGLPVTCEVTPHHLISIDEDVKDANWKMNPPLRGDSDRDALVKGLLDGTIDIVATDHAPHTAQEKSKSIAEAPFGIVGLETAFPLIYTKLVRTGKLPLARLIEAMTIAPAKLFGFDDRGKIEVGCAADFAVIDLDRQYQIDPEAFKSKGRNTPYGGEKVYGKVVLTVVGGKVVYNA